ncbi:MAG: VWA domain-containing protein, partial [Anaerolineales bacterium]|nr:VWA domain-containing protein [Anaerolineales bacterium]
APAGTLLDNDDIAELPLELGVDIPVFGGIADDADGRRILTGFAAPFTEVEILINGELAGTATSDGAGDWSFDLGDRRFDLELELRAAADPLLTTGPFGVFNRARITLDDVASEELAIDNFALNIAGHAEPGSQVGVYLNDELIQIVPVAADGSWSYYGEHPRGLYELTVGYGDISLAISEPWNISQSLVLGGPVGQLQIALGGEDASPNGLGVAPAGGPVVHIILDASWSMSEPLGDATRFEVARAAVAGIINNSLPDNTPVSLRIFGNLEGDLACQTDLMIPYGTLDRAAFNEVLNAAEPQFDANTAIAASLAAVPADLAAAPEEEHIIVLLTDGQETCGGDPAAEIQALNDAGFNVVVNIVGLSIDDEALATQFAQWAELGNGTYFAADDAEGLNSAVADAMRISYLVYDETAEIVAIGRIGGEPINLPPGSYTIEVLTAPRTIFTEVEIVEDELTSFSLAE